MQPLGLHWMQQPRLSATSLSDTTLTDITWMSLGSNHHRGWKCFSYNQCMKKEKESDTCQEDLLVDLTLNLLLKWHKNWKHLFLFLHPPPLTPLNIAENEEEELRMRTGRFCTFARSTSKTPPSPPMKVPSKMNWAVKLDTLVMTSSSCKPTNATSVSMLQSKQTIWTHMITGCPGHQLLIMKRGFFWQGRGQI